MPLSHGLVNFPFNDSRYASSGDAGTRVRLVAVYDSVLTTNSSWSIDIISYPEIHFWYTETVGIIDALTSESVDIKVLYPNIRDHTLNYGHQFSSAGVVGNILLGTTNWTGISLISNDCWKCSYHDLTEEGKETVSLFTKLYANYRLLLVTEVE